MKTTCRVGAVAIGRNEGQRLISCLHSLLAAANEASSVVPVVYVDSASTDGSAERARDLGASVVELDLSRKFTAARARNTGFEKLKLDHPEIEYVLFIDGDCELDPSFLARALSRIEEDEKIAVVCGRRKERFPEASVFNRLCDIEWDTPVGEADACGGDALMRASVLCKVGGYREGLIAGEEPELCFRMRKRGYRILRINSAMTSHDAAMMRVSQWYSRTRRSGHASAEHASLYYKDAEKLGLRPTVSNLVWGIFVPSGCLAVGALGFPTAALLSLVALKSLLYFRSYRYERYLRENPRTEDDALLYAAACVASKFPEAMGALTYFKNRLLRRSSTIIEYKGAASDS